MSQTVEVKFAKHYTTAGGRNAGAFPWASIISLIMGLFTGCTTPAAAKRWARKHEDAFKDMVDAKLKDMSTFGSARDRKAAVDAAYNTFVDMTDDEIRTIRNAA